MDKYVGKIITASRNHLKPIQGGTIRKEGMNGRHYVEDMIAVIPCVIRIAFDFRYLFPR